MINDIQGAIILAEKLLIDAQKFFDSAFYDDAEKAALDVLDSLCPLLNRTDLGEETDKNSLKYKIILILPRNRVGIKIESLIFQEIAFKVIIIFYLNLSQYILTFFLNTFSFVSIA